MAQQTVPDRDRTDRLTMFRHFDALPGIEPSEMFGRWRGCSVPTGHPLDGLLETLGWYGKAFRPPDLADPLLFRGPAGRILALNPSLLPAGVALGWPRFSRSAPTRAAFVALLPLLATNHPAARLRRLRYRGLESAAMVYDRRPITDHFRRVCTDELLGVMETRGAAPFFFRLLREAGPSGASAAHDPLPAS